MKLKHAMKLAACLWLAASTHGHAGDLSAALVEQTTLGDGVYRELDFVNTYGQTIYIKKIECIMYGNGGCNSMGVTIYNGEPVTLASGVVAGCIFHKAAPTPNTVWDWTEDYNSDGVAVPVNAQIEVYPGARGASVLTQVGFLFTVGAP